MNEDVKQPSAVAWARGAVRGWHVFALYGLVFVLALVLAHLLSRGTDPLFRTAWRTTLWGVLTFALVAVATVCVPELRRLAAQVLREGNAPSPVDVLIVVGLMLAWGLGASRLAFHLPIVLFDPSAGYAFLHLGRPPDIGPTYLFLATLNATLLAPLCEELVFRGYLLNLWLARYRMWTAIWLSSLAFGLSHLQWAPFATVMGFFLAMVYMKYRSLVLCMLLHGLYNLLVQRVLLGQFFVAKDRETVTSLSSWSLELLLAILFVPLLFLFLKRFRPKS